MIRLDHSGKDERKGMRGGSAKAGDVDAVWLLTKLTDTKLRLECGDTRMRLDTKLLKIARCSEPLRHELEGADALTTYEAKILELVRLCDNDDLPAEANRDGVRDVAKRHGMKVATQVIAEVVKRRKADPTLPVSTSENDSENADPEGQVNIRSAHMKQAKLSLTKADRKCSGQPRSALHGEADRKRSTLWVRLGGHPVKHQGNTFRKDQRMNRCVRVTGDLFRVRAGRVTSSPSRAAPACWRCGIKGWRKLSGIAAT